MERFTGRLGPIKFFPGYFDTDGIQTVGVAQSWTRALVCVKAEHLHGRPPLSWWKRQFLSLLSAMKKPLTSQLLNKQKAQ